MLLVYVTFPSRREAMDAATQLVKGRLAACVNIFPISALYLWRGRLERARECAALFKTTLRSYKAFERRLRQLHPYEVPCIIAWRIDKGSGPFLQWVEESCQPRSYKERR